ncbi:hypothetical protein PILCRDRAFT_93914 [Piloderma croceum F 1598]|uniref:Uncharacterized protein n=1 Tax=Piloderma croceum (strain F 1598) TaxID=765440 RepID=A0A0C3ETC0_PILCF|nr:hypothetical protein PILCRDRAFT_93914 [Piloderma croceum F 1598]
MLFSMWMIVLLTPGLAGTAFAQVKGRLYTALGCPSDQLSGTCTAVPAEGFGCCGSDVPGLYFWSGKVSGFGNGVTILTDSGCNAIKQAAGSKCLSTGSQNVFGVTWGLIRNREITNSSDCEVHYADVYHIALPGKQRKPYSVTVTKQLDHVGAIDWSTHTFKTDKLSVVQQIYAQHGDGLNEAQLAALAT